MQDDCEGGLIKFDYWHKDTHIAQLIRRENHIYDQVFFNKGDNQLNLIQVIQKSFFILLTMAANGEHKVQNISPVLQKLLTNSTSQQYFSAYNNV